MQRITANRNQAFLPIRIKRTLSRLVQNPRTCYNFWRMYPQALGNNGEQAGVEVGYLPSTPGTRVQIPGRASE